MCIRDRGKNEPNTNRLIQAPIRDVLPLFMREGSIVYEQDTEGVERSIDLTNEFTLRVALTEPDEEGGSHASGKILLLANASDQESAMKCFDQHDVVECFANVGVFTKRDENGGFVVTLSIFLDEPAAQKELIGDSVLIKSIVLLGVRPPFEERQGRGVALLADSDNDFTYISRSFRNSRFEDMVVEITTTTVAIKIGQIIHFKF
eukprot:TRINITY_DN33040_c0_g2_i2.p1 TRINITY_DN33040_c0_g2~~TRINITY_DN33040_c0_g2_i2.p1  ORF type:complete len:225 (+),score=40.05 TRINITY_DN33040_c0_g2_i2:61-675(+)